MTGANPEQWLIVQPVPTADERFSLLLPALARLGLDSYTARQRLIGQAPALLAKGAGEKMGKAGNLLADHGFGHWLLTPTRPRLAPERIFSVQLRPEAIHFTCRGGEVLFPHGAAVVAVLADLSGRMPEKLMQRLLAQNAYRGADYLAPAGEEEICREILRGEPVLDLYLLTGDADVEKGVRLFPGRFDPKGLGDRASYSAAGNLAAVLDVVRQHCAARLQTGFGLSGLPGCRPRRPEPGVDHQRESLLALTRFGWLMVDMERAERTAAVATAASRSGGAIGALHGVAAAMPPAQAVLAAVAGAPHPAPPTGRTTAPQGASRAPGLPAPPDLSAGHGRIGSGQMLFVGAAVSAALAVIWVGGNVYSVLWRHGVQSGVLPSALSLALFFAGMQAVRLKRQIENTPTSRVRSLAMGMVEVQGRAVRQYALVAPMTQTACVWYRLRRYRRDRNSWRVTSTRVSGAVPFLLDDGSGRIEIDPAGATMCAGSRQEGFDGAATLLSPRGGGDPDEKWVEETIAEGTWLYVLGCARERRRNAPSLAESTRERLRRLKGDAQALKRFDADGDGRVSAEEWELARSAMESAAIHEQLTGEGTADSPVSPAVIGRPPGRTGPFIIAETESEARLAGRYALIAAAMFVGGLLVAGWSASIILPLLIF